MHELLCEVTTAIRRTFDYRGRSRRAEYWSFTLFTLVINTIAWAVDGLVMRADGIVSGIIAVALAFPHFAVSVRRLHDVGRSGWWMLLVFLPLIGPLVLLYWSVLPGDDGKNAYGRSAD